MADRQVKVTAILQASQYIQGLEKMQRKMRETAKDGVDKLAEQKEAMNQLGTAAVGVGVVTIAAVGLAVSKFAEFDKAMSGVAASTHESSANMDLLREAALSAGADTVYSATEAAGAINELAKAGVSTKDILGGGLNGALALASAGSLDVADAAEIAATAMTQFGLKGSEVPHIADLLAAGAGKAQGSVEDLSNALNQGGLVASQAGFSIEETTGTLAAFAAAGLVGSDAGTSLKTAILALQNPSDKARGIMEDYGLSIYDSSGNMLSFSEIAGQLESKLGGLTDEQRNAALATIFGNDAVRAANVLYENGADGITEWSTKVNDAGYAAITAATNLDNLSGDLEYLGGAIDTGLIKAGSGANEVLREMVQRATDVADGIGEIPAPLLSAGVALTGTIGGFSLLGGTLLVGATRVGEMRRSFATLNEEMPKTAKFATSAAKGLGLVAGLTTVAVVLDAIANSGNRAGPSLEQTARAMKELDGIDKIFSDLDGVGPVDDLDSAIKRLLGNEWDENLDPINRWASGINQALGGPIIGDSIETTRKQFEKIDDVLKALVEGGAADEAATQFRAIADAAEAQGIPTQKLMDELLPGYAEALQGATVASEDSAAVTEENAAKLEELSGKAQSAETDIDALAETIRGFGSAQLDVNAATREFEASIDELSASVEKNGTTLDVTTEQGRSNQASLDALAQSSKEVAAATGLRTGSEEEARAALQRGREELIRQLGQFGITGQAAEDYADDLGLIPDNITTAVGLTGDAAVAARLDYLTRNRTISITTVVDSPNGAAFSDSRSSVGSANGNIFDYAIGGVAAASNALAFANGGFAPGIYAGRTGSIHKFAEPETRWEAYISGRPGQEARNLAIWEEAGERLGAFDRRYGAEAFNPRSLAPMPSNYSTVSTVDNSKTVAPVVSLGNGNTFNSFDPKEFAKDIARKQSQALALYDS
ncbi:phage tail tape measure protein [Rathayibacter sp. VKM Ac-2835]|uniref:phage tail tape measure protein n=1 Tax=Rathayibacter sp. VKM Ac-2835 TaxID=2739043 RepID=UPI001565A6C1|nr:phage tail tape measure protein [Rathayibacter sp. VKM Ac-2835]NRG40192.1 phage tail tape measure protein [Rathayibacter sp. VKM Ac-2835]